MREQVHNAGAVGERVSHAGALWVVLGVGALWLAIGVGDWWMRFRWFRWQDTWMIRPEIAEAPVARAGAYTNAAHRGGDLTGLAALPAFSAPFEEDHPQAVEWTDEFGYRNKPPTLDKPYPIVTVGDSYMVDGASFDTTFFSRLSDVSGVRVYNHAVVGRGSFAGILRFLSSERFRKSPPRVLIWGIIEREIAGGYFAGLVAQLQYHRIGGASRESKQRYDLGFLSAKNLRRSLPNTSAFAQLSAKAWNRIRYYMFGNVHPYVVVPQGEVAGRKVLFYREAIDAMKWPPQYRDLDKVTWAIGQVDHLCRERGIQLVIVLIPDKEEIYREHIPASQFSVDQPLQPSCLDELARKLEQAGIPAASLLQPFLRAASKGSLLYYADDTHWNSEAIDLAARVVWQKIAGKFGLPAALH
jgi:hypothetical protein